MLKGHPMLEWVWKAARNCSHFDVCVFAVDSDKVFDLVTGFGADAVMTSVDCQSGTDRLIEVQKMGHVKPDIWVNWQGDEPFITSHMIDDLLQSCDCPCDIWTLKHSLKQRFDDPSIVKVVTDKAGKALYFSRCPIPYGDKLKFKHVGLYAYSDDALRRIAHLEPSQLEKSEALEQLRFLENGLTIQVHETDHETVGIDLPKHLAQAEKLLNMKDLRLTPDALPS